MMDRITTVPVAPQNVSPAASQLNPSADAKAASEKRNTDLQRPKGSKESDDFAAQMQAQAALLTMAGAPQMPVAKAGLQELLAGALSAGAASVDESGAQGSELVAQVQSQLAGNGVAAEHKQLNTKSGASLNTGAMIAGLQPWNKDWVFEGVSENTESKAQVLPAQLSMDALAPTAGQKILTRQGQADLAEKMMSEMGDSQAGIQDPFQNIGLSQMRGDQAAQSMDAQASLLAQPSNAQTVLTGGRLTSMDGGVLVQGAQVELRPSGNQALSGAEFLSTLAAGRSGAQGQMQSAGAGANPEGGNGSPDQQSGRSGLKLENQVGAAGRKTRGLPGEETSFDSLSRTAGQIAGGASSASGSNGAGTAQLTRPTEMQGHVTQGSMTQDRLASESLIGLGSSIRNLTPQGGGEIRIKLNPENLGELHLRVMTNGSQVGLQIQASDEKARKIIEQSMGDLKDSLASLQLHLGKVELTVAQASGAFSSNLGSDHQGQSQPQPQAQNASGGFQDMMNGNNGGRFQNGSGTNEGGTARESWNAAPLRTGGAGRMMAAGSSASNGLPPSRRLDVRA